MIYMLTLQAPQASIDPQIIVPGGQVVRAVKRGRVVGPLSEPDVGGHGGGFK